jgi:glycine/D-amino acid oxidase-like deaminating enzyme
MGHLAVMDDSEAQFALTSYSQMLWRELAAELPPEVEYLPCGSLWVAADEEEMAEVRRKHRFYSARGIAVDILDEKQLAAAEPGLRAGLAGGLLMPSDSVCYPPSAAHFLLMRAQAQVLLGRRVVRVSDSGVWLADGEHLSAGLTVVAAGTATRHLLPDLPVVPRKGHLLITDRYPGLLHHQLIELGYLKSAHSTTIDSVAFNAQPRATGQLLIGSSRQYGAEDPAIERRILGWMLRRAIEYMPALADLSAIRAWTGFRPATPDKLPLIGRCPGFESLYVAAGHEGLGISTSLASARLLVDEILGRSSAIPRADYAPERSFAHA